MAEKHRTDVAVLCGLLVLVITVSSQQVHAQLRASASVRLTAILPSSVKVNQELIPVSFSPHMPFTEQVFEVPIEVRWNLNPQEVQGFEVIAYFERADVALSSDRNHVLSAAHIQGRWGSAEFQSFNNTYRRGTPGASLRLFGHVPARGNLTAQRTETLELRIEPQSGVELEHAAYRGTLHVEVRLF